MVLLEMRGYFAGAFKELLSLIGVQNRVDVGVSVGNTTSVVQ